MKSAARNLMLAFALFLFQNIHADTTQLTPKCNEPTAEGDRACWMKASNHGNCYVWNPEPQTNESVSWSGACKAGVAHGPGEETWQWDGELGGGQATAFGSYSNGKAVGQWEAQFADGTVMAGSYVDGKEHGKWEIQYGDGRIDEMLFDKGEVVRHTPRFNPKFVVEGDILHYNTGLAATEESREITSEDLEFFEKVLKENPDIKVVYLTSWGGDVEASNEIASLIIDYELDTHAVDICFSACPTILLGGNKRTLQRGSKIGFHRSWWDVDALKYYYEYNKEAEGWDDVFAFAAWVHDDALEGIYRDFEFLLERGVAPLFAIKTLREGPEGGWYPRRRELLDANFLTEDGAREILDSDNRREGESRKNAEAEEARRQAAEARRQAEAQRAQTQSEAASALGALKDRIARAVEGV